MRGLLILLLLINFVIGMREPIRKSDNLNYPVSRSAHPPPPSPVYDRKSSSSSGGARKRVLNQFDTPIFLDSNNSPSSEYGTPSNTPSNSYAAAPTPAPSYDAPSSFIYDALAAASQYPSNTYDSPPSPPVSYNSPDIISAYNSPPSSNSYNSPSISTSYDSPPPSNSYNSPPAPPPPPPPSMSYNSPPSSNSYEADAIPPSVSYNSPPSSVYEVALPQPDAAYDASPPSTSYDSPSPDPPSTLYGVTDPHKSLHKFRLIPILVLYGFFMIGITWIFLRVGFFTQVGLAGNFKRSLDSFFSILESTEDYSSFDQLAGNVFKAFASTHSMKLADIDKKSR